MSRLNQELEYILSDDFRLGEFIYIGKGKTKDDRSVVMSVGYKIDYAIKKAVQLNEETHDIYFTHINKVKVGELVSTDKFRITDEIYQRYLF